MKAILLTLIVLLLVLQYKLWFGDGNMREVWRLQGAIEEQKKENEKLDSKIERVVQILLED